MAEAVNHEALAAFLSDGANYPWPMGKVRVIQTHISWVFVGERAVFKVKKPVRFAFLDFSTLAKRREATEEELRVNRRMAAELYEGVVPVRMDTRRGFSFGGKGKVAAWGLRMKRFPDEAQLSWRMDHGVADAADMRRAARWLAEFYRHQMRTPVRDFNPRKLILDNLDQAAHALRAPWQTRSLDLLRAAQTAHLDHLSPLIQTRIGAGMAVDGHGDLHAEHLLFFENPRRVAAFDAIEFQPAFRRADVAYDLSFLVMDLAARGFPQLARVFLKEAQAALKDPGLPRLMPCYTAHRAAIRAKATALKAAEPEVPPRERRAAAKASRHYLQTALRLAHLGLDPAWIVIMGPIASGKSTLAAGLAKALGVAHINSDVVRKSLFGLAPTQNGSAMADSLYSPEATARTYNAMAEEAAAQGQAVLDATYSKKEWRDALRKAAKKSGARLLFFIQETDPSVLRKRLKAREGKSLVTDAREGLLDQFMRHFEWPGKKERVIYLPSGIKKQELISSAFREMIQDFSRHS